MLALIVRRDITMTRQTPIALPEERDDVESVIESKADSALSDRSKTQEWERAWHGTCANTFGEEAKQLTYAHLMGLVNIPVDGKWPVYDLNQYSVIDLGGGPASMLLKTVNGSTRTVVDPCPYPGWVNERYAHAGIDYHMAEAETFGGAKHSECWIYNVLQHVLDPEQVIESARRNAHVLRIFEWLETPVVDGHPHTLHAHELNAWIGGVGHIGHVDENGATGLAYWGVFPL